MKKLGSILLGGILLASLSGCGEGADLYFEGTKLPETQVEEIIEDRLEAENGLDYEVDIYEEVEE